MLDAINQAIIWESLRKVIKKRKLGVLAISHDMALLHQIAHRIIDFKELNHAL